MDVSLPRFLLEPRLRFLLFGGKGGVGKTTCAVGCALYLARQHPEMRVLLISIDPAHSLQDCLGRPVATVMEGAANLRVLEFDAHESLLRFKRESDEHLRNVARRGTFFDEQDIDALLDQSLPGLDETMAFLDLAQWVERKDWDCIVVDTAPTGHALSFLRMPELLTGWLRVLDALLAKHRYMKSVFGRVQVPDPVDRFLASTDQKIQGLNSLLANHDACRFIPVMLPEIASVRETENLLADLDALTIAVSEIVVNRVVRDAKCAACRSLAQDQAQILGQLPAALCNRDLWTLPWLGNEAQGTDIAQSLWQQAVRFEPAGWSQVVPAAAGRVFAAPVVAAPLPFPHPACEILFFGGKGGVGKTTLACAAALRLAGVPRADLGGRPQRVLLVSTDPAHSLSHCLATDIGAKPVALTPTLDALEVDGHGQFERLRAEYAADVERAFRSGASRLDPVFDRLAMQALMDLTPAGLDELMALLQVLEARQAARHDLIVVDTAPSGHLIRLLELPELLQGWIKAFFDLLLKYRDVFRLTRFGAALVTLSRRVKALRSVLADPQRAALYAVATPQRMVLAETADLLDSCARLGLAVPALLLNLIPAGPGCSSCTAAWLEAQQVEALFGERFPAKPLGRILKGSAPHGMAALASLSHDLFVSER